MRARPPTLEIHVPISPTPSFLTMVRCLASSLRRFGGAHANAPLIVTVGDDPVDAGLARRAPWADELGVEFRWLPVEAYRRDIYYATALERFRYPFDADVVLQMDADTLVAGPLDELVEDAFTGRHLCGLIAHVSPFSADGLDRWESLMTAAGVDQDHRRHQHTGWPYMDEDPSRRWTPPYFNFGVLCAPADVMNEIGDDIYETMGIVNQIWETQFRCQLGLGLSVLRRSIPYVTMPMRWNFANDPRLEALHPHELEDVRILHVLRDHQGVSKRRMYDSLDNLRDIVARDDLVGVNKEVQRVLAEIIDTLRGPTLVAA